MSCVKLDRVEYTKNQGTVLYVSGVDMMNGTPILDIKPYISYTDSHPEASQSFAGEFVDYELKVNFPQNLLDKIPAEKQAGLLGILKQDPRPAYHNDPERIYGVRYMCYDVHFTVDKDVLTVVSLNK